MSVGEKNSDPADFGDFVADYERIVDPLTLPIGCYALELANVAAGTKVIDVAAGTGALAVEAAARGISVLATDISPEMVARSSERLAPYPTSEAQVMSFESLEVADGAFDAAFSIVGVLAFKGGESGLREMVRVTRPGGPVVVATWDQERPAAPQYLARDIFSTLFPGRRLWPDGFFPVWSRSSLEHALAAAGCEEVEIRIFEGEWLVVHPAKVMDDARLSIARLPGYAALDADKRRQFNRAFTDAVLSHVRADASAHVPTRAILGIGRVSKSGEVRSVVA